MARVSSSLTVGTRQQEVPLKGFKDGGISITMS